MFESDIASLSEKADKCIFIVCYTEKWYENLQKLNKREEVTFTL